MDPRLLAVLTILTVGILCFLIGLLITSSKWKKRFQAAEQENKLLTKQHTELSSRIATLEAEAIKSTEAYEHALVVTQEIETDRDRLKRKNTALSKEIRDLKNINTTDEITRLQKELAAEQKRRITAEDNLHKLKNPNPVKGKNMDIQTNASTRKGASQSLTYRLTNIFNKIGLKDPNKEDDLTEINGIGEEISKKLNEIGIYNFKQIAQLQDADLEVIDEALEFFPGRALRDDWIGQAQEFQNRKPA